MKFEVFGKPGCAKCKSTKDKLTHLLVKAGTAEAVPLAFVDLETIEGMAEGAFNDVRELPTVILRSDSGEALARWDGQVPLSSEIQAYLGAARGPGAVA
jgi:glutaredoxin